MSNGGYCTQAAICVTGQLPVVVDARCTSRTASHLTDIEKGIKWTMYFDQELEAVCETNYVKDQNKLRAETDTGWFELAPSFSYGEIKGSTHDAEVRFEPINQQTIQMDDFAQCILSGTDLRVSTKMGLRDVKIISSIYESARKKSKIWLDSLWSLANLMTRD